MADSVTFVTPPTGANAPEPEVKPNADRPTWLPENFATPEDFAKSYGELQTSFTQSRQELAKLKGEPAPTEEAPKPAAEAPKPTDDPNPADAPAADAANPDDAQKVADAAGFDLGSYSQEFDQTGDVTAENRVKIAEGLKGVLGENAPAIVEAYIEGQKLIHANDNKLFMDTAGGSDNYNAMIEWAKDNVPREEALVYNDQVNSGNRHAVMFAISGLKAKFEKANGKPSTLVTGGAGNLNPVSGAGFKSTGEMTAAMNDPRYKTDQAYRDQVAERIRLGSI